MAKTTVSFQIDEELYIKYKVLITMLKKKKVTEDITDYISKYVEDNKEKILELFKN